ncbi:MAG TPA: hypothetical protein VFS74_02325 [Gemmatimonadales bacterium]|nr:hypothetical protein [Gemmatimonadales bacterium]
MRVLTMLFLIAAVPAAAAAQSASDTTQSSADVRVSTGATMEIQALRQEARDRQVPEQAVANVIAEGRAKGASDAQLVSAGQASIIRLATAKQALISAGRERPSDTEVQQGATLMAQGATRAQLTTFAAKASADRSLSVAFASVASLAARGKPVSEAMSEISAELYAGASDAELLDHSGSADASGRVGDNVTSFPAAGAVSGMTSSTAQIDGGMSSASGQLANTGAVGISPR